MEDDFQWNEAEVVPSSSLVEFEFEVRVEVGVGVEVKVGVEVGVGWLEKSDIKLISTQVVVEVEVGV